MEECICKIEDADLSLDAPLAAKLARDGILAIKH